MIVAHRGLSYTFPENTLSSIQHAWAASADAVEIDVRYTSDRRIMLMHDATTYRTTGNDYVMEQTSSEVLQTLDAGRWKSELYAGERIPFLEDVLPETPGKKRLFVEIKSDDSIFPSLLPMLSSRSATIIGFNFDVMMKCKKERKDLEVLWLYEPRRRFIIGPRAPIDCMILEKVTAADLDGIDLHFASITRDTCKMAQDYGLSVYAWTVDDIPTAERLLKMGVKGITSNRPDIMKTAGL